MIAFLRVLLMAGAEHSSKPVVMSNRNANVLLFVLQGSSFEHAKPPQSQDLQPKHLAQQPEKSEHDFGMVAA